MKWISRKHLIYPNIRQQQIIDKLLSNNDIYEFYNNNNIFFLDEYHEYIRVPEIGDIRIIDDYIRLKYSLNIIKIKLFKEYISNIKQYNYYLIMDLIINKDDELIIDILTNIHRKKKQDITLKDIDKIYNQNINDLELSVNKIKKKMDRLSTHTPYYWKMQKQLSKKEMKLMNAKMNKYEDMLKIENDNKIYPNNILSLIQNNNKDNNNSLTNISSYNNTDSNSSKNNKKIEIVYIDKERKYKNIK